MRDVIIFETLTGNMVIATKKDETEKTISVTDAYSVAPSEQGFGIIPYLIGFLTESSTLQFQKSGLLVSPMKVKADLKNLYLEKVSGIQIASSLKN